MSVTPPVAAAKFTTDQLINPGPRSGVIKHVPADGTLQAMVSICNPGDTIVVETTYVLTSPLVFRAEKNVNTTTCPKRADGTPADILIVANDPRFWNNTTNTFIPPSTRVLVNKDYPAGRTVCKVSNRVLYYRDNGHLPKIQPSTFAEPLNFTSLGTFAPGDFPAYYRIVGLQINQWTTGQGNTTFVTFAPERSASAPGTYGAPHHVVFDRCLWVSDPNDTGPGSAQVAIYNWCGAFNAVINCDFHNFYGPGAGDPKMMTYGYVGAGPYHFENNHCPVPNVLFTGGTGFTCEVGAIWQNFTMLRNHCHRPLWLQPTEDPRPNFTVNIAADGVSVSAVNMPWGESFVAGDGNPLAQKGGLLVDPATGICRPFAEQGRTFDRTNITLAQAWPGAPVNNKPVHIIYSNYVYASSLTGATCTTNGTTHVTTSAPIPATVLSEADLTDAQRAQDIRAHYFFITTAAPGWTVSSFPIFDTLPAHIKIISIDSNRLGMTLASVPPGSGTQPYFVTGWDGKYRPAHGSATGKAFGEYKMAAICEHEGNIFENNVELWRFHPTSQSDLSITTTVTVSGTSITGISGADTWWTGLSQLRFSQPSVEWPYLAVWQQAWWAGLGAAAVSLTSQTAGTLHDSTLPNGTYQVEIRWQQAPQSKVADQLWRYNIFRQFGTGPSMFPNTNVWEVRQSERFWWVDNLHMDFGAPHLPSGGTAEVIGHPISQGGPPGPSIPIGRGQRVAYGVTAREILPHVRVAHNTSIRAIPNGSADYLTVTHDTAPTTDADRSTDWEISDNIGHAVANMKSVLGHYGAQDASNVPAYIISPIVSRNVFVAPNAATIVANANFAPVFPDNVGLPDLTKVGMTDTAATAISQLTAYKLQDVYNTGTVSIAADGKSATLTTGTFPASVVVGQFFRADVAPLRKQRITAITTTTVSWSTAISEIANQTGLTYGIGFVGTASDGLDPGADIQALIDFTAGVDTVVEPDEGGGPPPPSTVTSLASGLAAVLT